MAIIRTLPDTDPRSAISTLARFTVTVRSSCDVSFELAHHVFDPDDDAVDILWGVVRSIPANATVLLRRHPVDPQDKPQAMSLRPTDAEFLAWALPDNTVIAFQADEHELGEAGTLVGLNMPGPGAPPQR
ncbi:hypothetical protein [Erythrobacter cryptus]|uniref:hypothetical protein n=1 Tax=Erythrobacter cryptus TaxID=196588 RepID=UPI00048585F2|nr:hypothetical protein [Erythrobacter cryptus]